MPGRRIVLAAALASSMLCPHRAGALDAHAVISGCAATAGANLQGLPAIRRVCPRIDQALASLAVGNLLPVDWDKRAGAAMLGDLEALAERYAGRPSSTPPASSDLRAIAVRLQGPAASPSSPSLWDHIRAWLRARLAPLGGLLKWLRSLPGGSAGSGARRILLVGAGVLILLSVVAVVIAELRAAGRFGPGRRQRSRIRRPLARARVVAAEEMAADDADAARALDRPASALRILIEALRRSRRIERDGNLTCREVLARAVFDTREQREGFAGIALLAERELFGPRGSPIRVPDELRSSLRALYYELSAAPAGRSAAS